MYQHLLKYRLGFLLLYSMKTKALDKYITEVILKPNRRRYNIVGAPFKIGDAIQVLDNPNKDETFDSDFSGKQGVVYFFEYDCGCGQSFPEDPMIGVRFNNNAVGEFWKDELILL
jgi:hypothetical protein